MTLHHLTGQVMDKVSGSGFVSSRHLHPRHPSTKQRKGVGGERKREGEKSHRELSSRWLPCPASAAFENPFTIKETGQSDCLFRKSKLWSVFCRLLFEVTLHESAFGWAASSRASPELKGPPISFPPKKCPLSLDAYSQTCLSFFLTPGEGLRLGRRGSGSVPKSGDRENEI